MSPDLLLPDGGTLHVDAADAPRTLEPERHLLIQTRIKMLAEMALDLCSDDDLDLFLASLERADSLGPIVDPTAWIAARESLALLTAHTRALARFRASVRAPRS